MDEAYEALEEALSISRELLGESHSQVAVVLGALAQVHHSQGRREEAEDLYRQALAMLEDTLGPEHPELAATWFNLERELAEDSLWLELSRRMLGESLIEQGRADEARPWLRQVAEGDGPQADRARELLEQLAEPG